MPEFAEFPKMLYGTNKKGQPIEKIVLTAEAQAAAETAGWHEDPPVPEADVVAPPDLDPVPPPKAKSKSKD